MRWVPATRLYPFKAWLLRKAGYAVASTARIVSSARIWGTMRLHIGDDSFVGHEVLICGGDCEIFIGDCVDIAPRVSIIAGTHHIDMVNPHSAGAGYSKDIRIEDGAWIGAGTTILGGVTIGRKAVIAAGSVVTSDIPAFTLAAGVPCRPRKTWQTVRQQWSRLEAA
jgi:maltose O-acetyltransferase